MQYAILFDRLFRFPLTGDRIRNYDGLGGQLLFAFLHREGYLHWTDNRLTIEWERIADGVEALREKVQALYHSGIDRSKLSAVGRRPRPRRRLRAAGRRLGVGDATPRPPGGRRAKELVDLVNDDEFPLSLFYTQLTERLDGVLRRPDDAL